MKFEGPAVTRGLFLAWVSGMTHGRFILTLQCPDAVGIVAATATFLAERRFSIEESDQFHDLPRDMFFMRTAFSQTKGETSDLPALQEEFTPIAKRFDMQWRIHDLAQRPRIVVAVSKIGHCLHDLLHREETGWLDADVVAVVSNHSDLAAMVKWRDKPFQHVPLTPATKAGAEARLLEIMTETGAEL